MGQCASESMCQHVCVIVPVCVHVCLRVSVHVYVHVCTCAFVRSRSVFSQSSHGPNILCHQQLNMQINQTPHRVRVHCPRPRCILHFFLQLGTCRICEHSFREQSEQALVRVAGHSLLGRGCHQCLFAWRRGLLTLAVNDALVAAQRIKTNDLLSTRHDGLTIGLVHRATLAVHTLPVHVAFVALPRLQTYVLHHNQRGGLTTIFARHLYGASLCYRRC